MSDIDITVKVNSLKNAIEKGKTERTIAETNKKTYEEQLTKTEDEIRALGVEPGEVDKVIAELDAEIAADLAEVEKLIPETYRLATFGG